MDKLEPFRLRESKDVPFLSVTGWEPKGARAVFSTRMGGVSRGKYAWLNLGLSTGDSPEGVQENRRAFWEAVGVKRQDIAQTRQIHGNGVALSEKPGIYADTDALVTSSREVVLAGTFADCVPIYVYDPGVPAVALVHAGWRGTLSRVVTRALKVMVDSCAADPQRCLAAIGPSIGACCYQVGDDVASRFRQALPFAEEFLSPDGTGSCLLDLKGVNERHLVDAGVPRSQIEVSGWCTACNGLMFFSHRRDGGETGRMTGAIWLDPCH